jgi:hypothetical protein
VDEIHGGCRWRFELTIPSGLTFRGDSKNGIIGWFAAIRTVEGGRVMAVNKRTCGKKHFTVAEANAMLPLVRAIVRDVTELARDLKERQERLARVRLPESGHGGDAYREELNQVQADFEREQERMQEYVAELHKLGVELKDYFSGLVDFPSRLDNREIYLCWRLGEPDVAHWHELEAGFQGRQKLLADAAKP